MSVIQVSEGSIVALANKKATMSRNAGDIASSIRHIKSNLDWEIKGASSINTRLNDICNSIGSYASALSSMRDYLYKAAQDYKDCEKANSDIDWILFKNSVNDIGKYVATSYLYPVLDWFSGTTDTDWAEYFNFKSYLEKSGKEIDEKKGTTSYYKYRGGFSYEAGDYKASHDFRIGEIYSKETNKFDPEKMSLKIGQTVGVAGMHYKATHQFGDEALNLKIKQDRKFVTGEASYDFSAGLYEYDKEGNLKFKPHIGSNVKIGGSVFAANDEIIFGNDQMSAYVKGEAKVLTAEYEHKVNFDLTSGKVGVKSGFDAALAKGEVKGGFKILGLDIGIAATGKAGAVGLGFEVGLEDSTVTIGAGIAAILGGDFKITVSW